MIKETIDNILSQAHKHAERGTGTKDIFYMIMPNGARAAIGKRSHPAIDFAVRNNMPDILGQYDLTPGVTPSLLQDFAIAANILAQKGHIEPTAYLNMMQTVWDRLADANPVLTPLAHDAVQGQKGGNAKDFPYTMTYHLIMGVGDQFHPEDIRYFLNCTAEKRTMDHERLSKFFKKPSIKNRK